MTTATQSRFTKFEWRVREVRAWKGLVIGSLVTSGISLVWTCLDWFGVLYAEWPWLIALVAVGLAVGSLCGLAAPISPASLADSIDRRANLENRLGSSQQVVDGEFAQAIQADAEAHLAAIRPAQIYPIRLGRQELISASMCALCAAIFLLGNSTMFLSDKAKRDRANLQSEAKNVERVTRENLEQPEAKQDLSDQEKQMANELNRLSRDMEKAHVSKEEAQAKENDLAKKADELMHKRADQAQQSLATAQSALEQMERGELDRQGMRDASISQAQMSQSELQSARSQNKAKQADLRKQLSEIDRRLAELRKKLAQKGLSEAERKELERERKLLEAQRKALEQQLKSAEEDAKALELSEEARKVFQKLTQDPLFKKLQELQAKMAKDLNAMQQGQRPPLTKEEREQLKREMEELARQLKDDKAMKEYLQAMLDAMKQAKGMGRMLGVGRGLNLGIPMWGGGAPGDDQDRMPYDLGRINKTDKPQAGRGSTNITSVTGEKRPSAGPEQYVEIKAPSTVGNRSAVPYVNVLPSYRRKAEEALDHQQIPKDQEKRVREYFESLNGK